MDTMFVLIMVAVLVALTGLNVFMIISGIKALRMYDLIKRTPTSISVDVDKGLTEVKGVIQQISGSHLFTSPFGQVRCVMYKAEVEERVSSGKSSRWVTKWEEKRGRSFLVRDGSGLSKVDTEGGEVQMARSYHDESSAFGGISSTSKDILTRLGLPLKGTFGIIDRTYRLHEEVLRPDREVYVLGTASEMTMEPVLERDPKVNPYTIHKENVLIVSTKDEGEVGAAYLTKGILLIAGAILIDIGALVLIFFFIP